MFQSSEVIDEVTETVKKYGSKDFIVGYRLSPEEAESPAYTWRFCFFW
jgi:2,4-dienoyl-CoA reductase-like NADH-dependent reductase (Old Yellow Enzyme family)